MKQSRAVSASEDFHRIRGLPVRQVTDARAARDNAALTPLLTTPAGRKAGVHLVGLQGFVLRELAELGGSYSGLPVGGGKTLVSFLAPYVVEAQRPMLVIPSSLREKTWNEFSALAKHWVSPSPPARVLGYNEFTQEENVDLFEQLRPDFVMLDEADRASNQDGSFTKRLARWKVKSGCKVWSATGTGTRWSTEHMSHLLVWSLEEGAPWPLDPYESELWSAALDEKPARFAYGGRPRTRVGVLVDLVAAQREPEMTDQGLGRLAFRTRMLQTPGVVISDEDSCKMPLTIELKCAPEDETINDDFEHFRLTQDAPDGWKFVESLELYSHELQLGKGMYLEIFPRPPDDYIEARRACGKFIRHWIERTAHHNIPECDKCGTAVRVKTGRCAKCGGKVSKAIPLDTPEAVIKQFRDEPAIVEWLDVYKPSFKGTSRPVWRSASVVKAACAWARAHVGIIWTSFEAVGAAIAKASGLKYYGPGGLSIEGQSIENAKADQPIVASIAANYRGRNLQRFCKSYIVGLPPSARDIEQLLGREHRRGQTKSVHATVLITSGLERYSWSQALGEAAFVKATQGQTQKILRAEIIDCDFPSDSDRWFMKEAA